MSDQTLDPKILDKFAQMSYKDNVRGIVRKPDGTIRNQFNPNRVGRWILRQIRKVVTDPYDGSDEYTVDHIKPGLMNRLAIWGLQIPFLTGRWLPYFDFKNGITNAGRADVSSRLNGSGGAAAFTSIGMGTGTTAFAATQTALITGVDASGAGDAGVHVLASGSVTVSLQTTTITNDTARLVGTVSITGTIAVTESGVFNANTNGTMLARQTFSAVNVVSGDSLQLQWDIKNA